MRCTFVYSMFLLLYAVCLAKKKPSKFDASVRHMLISEFASIAIGTGRELANRTQGEQLQITLFGEDDADYYPQEPEIQEGAAMAAVWLNFNERNPRVESEMFLIQTHPQDKFTRIVGWMRAVQNDSHYGLTVAQWAQTELDDNNREMCDTSGPEHLVDGKETRILFTDFEHGFVCKWHQQTEETICVLNITVYNLPLWGSESIVGRMMKLKLFDGWHVQNRSQLYLPPDWNTSSIACGIVGIANDFAVMLMDDATKVKKDASRIKNTICAYFLLSCIFWAIKF